MEKRRIRKNCGFYKKLNIFVISDDIHMDIVLGVSSLRSSKVLIVRFVLHHLNHLIHLLYGSRPDVIIPDPKLGEAFEKMTRYTSM